MLESREVIHQRSPDESADHEELGPAPASDPRPGVRSNNSSIERFPVQFSWSSRLSASCLDFGGCGRARPRASVRARHF